MTDFRKSGDICKVSQIIRAGDVYGHGRLNCPGEIFLQRVCRDLAGQQVALVSGIQPIYGKIQQAAGGGKYLVCIAPGGNLWGFALGIGPKQCQIQHSPNGKRRAFGGIQRFCCAKQAGSVFLTLGKNAIRVVQHIGAGYFRNVQCFAAQRTVALVPRHMQPQGIAMQIVPDKIAKGRHHIIRHPGSWQLPA